MVNWCIKSAFMQDQSEVIYLSIVIWGIIIMHLPNCSSFKLLNLSSLSSPCALKDFKPTPSYMYTNIVSVYTIKWRSKHTKCNEDTKQLHHYLCVLLISVTFTYRMFPGVQFCNMFP